MRRRVLLAFLLCATACGRAASDRTPSADSTQALAASRAAAAANTTPWPDMLGGFLALERPATGEALLFRRDTSVAPSRLAVIGYDSLSTPVSLRDVRPLPCATRALLRVDGAPRGWSVALDADRARPVLIDAIEDLPHADSQQVVIRIQRALNTLPDSDDAQEFHGLPVVVRDAWVVRFAPKPIIVARAARLRNLEAAAHEELRFAILEDDQVRFVARVAGEEETVESWDLLAALRTDLGPVLAVAREGTRSLQLELVALDGGAWKSVWRSDGLACGPAPK